MPRMMASGGWRIWIDRGGTFTDLVGLAPDGRLLTRKVLSDDSGERTIAAIRALQTEGRRDAGQPAGISELRMGTTVATNALLERRGAKTALLITRGFRDALKIGYQNRPDLFARQIRLPAALNDRVIECRERIGADGQVLEPLDEDALLQDLRKAQTAGISSLAIVLLHAYAYPSHEQRAAQLARELGFVNVSVSHELNPMVKLVARGDTTVVDAYLNPVLQNWVAATRQQLEALGPVDNLLFMQSNGGLTNAAAFCGKDSVLSGPAGGIVGMVASAASEGIKQVVGFDMGGTSTDVSIYDGRFERSEETEVAGARIRAAMLKIHTVAAGGGSILRFAEGRMQVGPASAGANPGPAAYGLGGPLTLTDCNLLLGRLQADLFPAILGPQGNARLQEQPVREAFAVLARQLAAHGFEQTAEQLALAFQEIAVQRMADAIRHISLAAGLDVRDFALACFGGAGPQYACPVAEALGIRTVLVHPLAGLLSALGIGRAPITRLRETTLRCPLDEAGVVMLNTALASLREAVSAEFPGGPTAAAAADLSVTVKLRYSGTDTALEVDLDEPATMRAAFAREHQARFGFLQDDRELVIETVMLLASLAPPPLTSSSTRQQASATPAQPLTIRPVIFASGKIETPVYRRADLAVGTQLSGPAIVLDDGATTVIDPGWQARLTDDLQLLLERQADNSKRRNRSTRADPASLEVFNNLFMHIAEQMGAVLRNTARSVNIKERLDFSCALFDSAGQLVANAPHMPVHLGSMGESVAAVIQNNPQLANGDVYMLNDPYQGGTHLPDITVVAPVSVAGANMPDFFVAARGHHADVGGVSPGSMPPDSRHIEQEGVLFSNFKLVSGGHFDEPELRRRLSTARWPARNPDQNVADLQAQVAACRQGARLLLASVERYGIDVVRAYLGHVQDNAEAAVRAVLGNLDDGSFVYPLDNGLVIRVAVTVDQGRRQARVDFSGTSAQHDGNFNAPYAVCRAAVLYVFRCLVDAPIPLNAGCLKPVELVVPAGCLLNPRRPAAVVAGNVETSQAVTNALFGAVGALAASQGTMNNFTFGNAHHQYYETVAGGAGAGPGFAGAHAVQTHMTNSRLTDPEILELRFPVRVRRFCIRQDSGGKGRHDGGNGALREIEFLSPMEAAILSGHRRIPPFGLAGGQAGHCGRNSLIRAGQALETELEGCSRVRLAAGDRIVIRTPGGGGYGDPDSEN